MEGQREDEMHDCHEQRADDDERGSESAPVVYGSEEWREHDASEGDDGGNESGKAFGDAVFHYHQLRGEVEEWVHRRVEQQTEQRDEPEARALYRHEDIGKAETLVIVSPLLCSCGSALFQPAVHDAIDDVEEQRCRDEHEAQE